MDFRQILSELPLVAILRGLRPDNAVAIGAALIEGGFRIIEVPPDEHRLYCPANLVILEPGKVIMPAQAKETIRRVREAGVTVLELDTTGIMAGTNGIRCVTMHLVRDEGPGLADLRR